MVHLVFLCVVSLSLLLHSVSSDVVQITVETDKIINTVDDKFLSFGMDTIQFYQTPNYPFYNTTIIKLAKHLSPAYLRVSGTDADYVYYGTLGTPPKSMVKGDLPPGSMIKGDLPPGSMIKGDLPPGSMIKGDLPPGYTHVLTPAQYDGVYSFATAVGMDILFGVNAGPGPRTSPNGTLGVWTGDDAAHLLDYTVQKGYTIFGWELGNEPDLWPFKATGQQLAQDVKVFTQLLKNKNVTGVIIEPEISSNLLFMEDYIQSSMDGKYFSFHFYPLDACNGHKPTPDQLLNPQILNKIIPLVQPIQTFVQQNTPKAQVWLGETSSIVCRGEHGVSDTFVDGFQYLDQLGLIAQVGVKVQIRQTLLGYETTFKYSMIDMVTGFTYPNYWNTLLFRRLVGKEVLKTISNNTSLRVYAHCIQPLSIYYAHGGITLLLLNLSPSPLTMDLPFLNSQTVPRIEYNMQAPNLTSYFVDLNGKTLTVEADGSLPNLEKMGRLVDSSTPVVVDGHSYSFIVFPKAGISVCN